MLWLESTGLLEDAMTDSMGVQQVEAVHLDAVNWFEIPTDDLDRAIAFYEMLLGQKMRVEVFGERIAMFPSSVKGVGGCLVQRDSQRPSDHGVLIYLNCDRGLDAAVDRLKASGIGALVLSKREVPGGFGWIACVRDTEGNHVALHEH
jgi:predicted enzyme related to lactoylglutathione lyase